MATTASPRSRSDHPAEDPIHACLGTIIDSSYYLGKAPLFVLGAGISAKRVPFIDEMAGRLVTLIRGSTTIPKAVKATLIKHGDLIQGHKASRSDAAEFFSTCQISPTRRCPQSGNSFAGNWLWTVCLLRMDVDSQASSDWLRSQTPMNRRNRYPARRKHTSESQV